jgi:hypothetical protein
LIWRMIEVGRVSSGDLRIREEEIETGGTVMREIEINRHMAEVDIRTLGKQRTCCPYDI